jgi:hypothetical protein
LFTGSCVDAGESGRKVINESGPHATVVISETQARWDAVIPAKAGIHSSSLRKWAVYRLDSRFFGNDRRFEMDPVPSDTTTNPTAFLTAFSFRGIHNQVDRRFVAKRLRGSVRVSFLA